jgi:hypothetical protein
LEKLEKWNPWYISLPFEQKKGAKTMGLGKFDREPKLVARELIIGSGEWSKHQNTCRNRVREC